MKLVPLNQQNSDLTKYILIFLNEGKFNGQKIIDKYFIKEMMKPRIFYNHNLYYCYGLKLSEMIIEDVFAILEFTRSFILYIILF